MNPVVAVIEPVIVASPFTSSVELADVLFKPKLPFDVTTLKAVPDEFLHCCKFPV